MNGQQKASENIETFKNWAKEREKARDWSDYIMRGKLNRTAIAAECGFAKSVLIQNPAVKQALAELEDGLRAATVIPTDIGKSHYGPDTKDDTNAGKVIDRHLALDRRSASKRINELEQINAALREELAELKERLRRYSYIERHLSETGRMVML